MNRRVVVTGMGVVCPLGISVEQMWANLLAGKSGIARIDRFDTSDLPCRIGRLIPRGPGGFDPTQVVASKELRRMDEFIVLALAAAQQAVDAAGLGELSDADRERIGVLIGSGIGGLPMI